MAKNSGKIQIYTGDGKGKTTASLGLAIRAIGNGLKVGIIYFDKGGDYYNERKILDKLKADGLEYIAFGEQRMTEGKGFRFKNNTEDLQQAQLAIDQALTWMQQDFDLLILDEINTTVKTDLLKLEDILHLISQKPDDLELVLTGRYCPPEVMDKADLITEMKVIKHYIKTGLPARPGIEF
ncbi:MAG: cob(I)yrinic acid a,c-diamide adenosyltransferase [Candidatus Komeilibacteria bacterium]|jgi:cob(I)alamin adenosyltransferase|nr:cob(I)yrinic acid a,c-diamide adenosyltransferase [Candidatus Komeilibacteria bacterium]MBT4447599.1 cob(I)yrinic acid a,c-diamide adenosyltransferase [Candidatus Komeilibacteria bacterium]